MSERWGLRMGRTLRTWTSGIEEESRLDQTAEALGRMGEALSSHPVSKRLLRGEWLGHALHPLLTDFPLGTWMSATLLDLFGDERSRPSAELLLAWGVALAAPTAITGIAELAGADRKSRRVATVHASVNSTALVLYSASLWARRRGKADAGTALALAGGLMATLGGYLGGHLSLVRAVGVEVPQR